ncbi:MAG: spirocyclase AveC family protein [Solirubrobacterales bacterium]|nr:spirocyclase AveC family protein [Solirubrobacterales bacterium]
MATTVPPVTEPSAPEHVTRRSVAKSAFEWLPIHRWAVAGIGFLLFWAYVLTRWVTGPYFERVGYGPDEPPLYMKIALGSWQAAAVPAVAFILWKTLIQPWRREGKINTLGLIMVATLPMALQDPISSYFGHWYTYNTWMVNFGAFTNEMPGWRAFGAPGAQQGYPILFHLLAYPLSVLIGIKMGCATMRWARTRFGWGPARLIAACFAAMLVFDFVLEGLFWAPLGFYSLTGGHFSLFPDTYHKFPLHEAAYGAAFFTAPALLAFFTNDKGETVVERGMTEMKGSVRRKTALRLLALIAALQVSYLLTYNLPIALFVSAEPGTWPKDVQQRTYLNNNLCGAGTDRLCPGNGVPLTVSMWVDNNGVFHGPAAKRLRPTPVNPRPPAPYSGRAFGSDSR